MLSAQSFGSFSWGGDASALSVIHNKVPLTEGCSEGLGEFRFFFKILIIFVITSAARTKIVVSSTHPSVDGIHALYLI